MPQSNDLLRGVFPVVQLPYHEDESIDFDTLRAEIDWLWDQGVDGLVVAMVTEVLRLSDAERDELIEKLCDWSRDRGPVVMSVGAESTKLVVDRTRQAASAGAAAVMAIPPVAIAIDDNQLERYFAAILDATDVPVIVQDASGYLGRPMSIAFMAGLERRFAEQIYFKPEAVPIGPRLSALRDATDGKARVFEGTGGIALVDSHRRGVVGTMPGADLIDALVRLWAALEAGETDTVDRIHRALCPLLSLIHSLDAFLAIEKHLLVRRGIFKSTVVRGPVGYTLDPETRTAVDRHFDHLSQVLAEAPAASTA